MANFSDAFRCEVLSLSDNVAIAEGNADPSTGAGESAPIGSLYLRHTGQLYKKTGLADVDWEEFKTFPGGVGTLNNSSTGLLTGGEISINADPTKFDVTAGTGIIVDNYTDILNPTYTLVSWNAFTAVVVDNLALADRSFIAIDITGSIVQSASSFTNSQHKDMIVLGNLAHATHVQILAFRNGPDPAYDATARLADLMRAIGAFNVSGNVFSANGANMLLDKTAGRTYRVGTNMHNDPREPDITVDSLLAPVTFRYSYRDGAGGNILSAPTTVVDSTNWDDGSGTLVVTPNGRWQVQEVHFFGGANEVRIEYGQQTFSTKTAALDILPDPDHSHNPAFEEGVVRAYLVLAAGATNLQDPADAEIVDGVKFSGGSAGGTSSGGVTNLQAAYTNSINPEITTDATRLALTVKEGLGVGGNLFEAKDDTDVTVFAVDTGGNISASTIDGRDPSADGLVLDTHVADTTNPHQTAIVDLIDVNAPVLNINDRLEWNGSVFVAVPRETSRIVGLSATDTTPGYLTDKLVAGTNVNFTVNNPGLNETLTISASVAGGGGGGEVNTASNIGAGVGLYALKSGTELQFKTLVSASGIAFTPTASTVSIDLSANLDDLTDVTILSLADGDGLIYNASALQFQNIPMSVPGENRLIRQRFGTISAYTGTAVIPIGETAPLVTEGVQVWAETLTPIDPVGSKFQISTSLAFSVSNAASDMVVAVFRDSVCIGVMIDAAAGKDKPQTISFNIVDEPVSGVPVTYSARVGKTSGGATWHINSLPGYVSVYGSTLTNNAYLITEVAP